MKPPSKPPFGSDGVPFTQWAAVNLTDKFIAVTPLSGYRRHLPEDEVYVIYLAPDATQFVLGQAVLKILDKSRFIHPRDDGDFYEMKRILEADKRWHEDFMTRYGYKTKRAAYKNMLYCLAERREGWILIKPHKRDRKPGLWWDLPEEKTVVFPATDNAVTVGRQTRLVLSHCE